MGEALISRAGGEGGNIEISNETKEILGVDNNASLDDCLQSLGLKDPNYATIIVTLKDVDGQPIPNSKINMRTNTTIQYTTNAIGQCMFKTNYGTATFSDITNNGYYDILQSNSVTVDCVVGGLYKINLQRQIRGNGYSINIASNQDLKFSKFLNTIDVTCYGAGGSGSTISHIFNSYNYDDVATVFRNNDGSYSDFDIGVYNVNVVNYPHRGEGGYINSSKINIESDKIYQCRVGKSSTVNRSQQINTYGTGEKYGGRWKYDTRFRNVSTNAYDGSTGGTTSFGDVLSALGGSGGVVNGQNKSNHGGTNGGYSTSYSLNEIPARYYNYGYNSLIIYFNYTSISGGGQNGYIWLNNFQYK